MKTYQGDGLVLYSGRPGRDFIAAEIVAGQLRLAYDLGSSPRAIRTALRHPVSDNRWHEVAILRPTLTELLLRVDNVSKSDALQDDLRSVYFDLDEDIYVGGIPETMFSLLHKQVIGCGVPRSGGGAVRPPVARAIICVAALLMAKSEQRRVGIDWVGVGVLMTHAPGDKMPGTPLFIDRWLNLGFDSFRASYLH